MSNEIIEAIEYQVISEEEFGAAGILPRMDPAVLHFPIAPV